MGKARSFSDDAEDTNYRKEFDDELYTSATQQNSYNLGSVHFSDQSGIGNFTQQGSDQRKADLRGALFRGNVGFESQTAFLDVTTNTIDLLVDGSNDPLSIVSSDKFVSLSAGAVGNLVTILGAQRPGQRLVLYGTQGNTITIKNTSGAIDNTIKTPGGLDLLLVNTEVVELNFDASTSQWRVIGGASGGGGGLSEPIILGINELIPVSLPLNTVINVSTKNPQHITLDRSVQFSFIGEPVSGVYEGIIVIIDIDGVGGFSAPQWPASVVNPPIISTKANTRTSVILYTIDGGLLWTFATSVAGGTGGGEFFGPWTADHNAGTFNLTNFDSLLFQNGNPDGLASTNTGITGGSTFGIKANVLDSQPFFVSEQSKPIFDVLQGFIRAVSEEAAPVVIAYFNDSAPLAGENVGSIEFHGNDSLGAIQKYGSIGGRIKDITINEEEGTTFIQATEVPGALQTYMELNPFSPTEAASTVKFLRPIWMDTGDDIFLPTGGRLILNQLDAGGTTTDLRSTGSGSATDIIIRQDGGDILRLGTSTQRALFEGPLENNSTSVLRGFIQFKELSGNPAAGTSSGKFYVKTVSGEAKPFFIGDGTTAVDLSASAGIPNSIIQGNSNVTVTDTNNNGLIQFTADNVLVAQMQNNRMDFQDTQLFGITQTFFTNATTTRTTLTQNATDFTMNFPTNSDAYEIDFNNIIGFSVDLLRTRLFSNTPNTTGATLSLFRNDASPEDDDELGKIIFEGRNSAAEQKTYANWNARAIDVTQNDEDGSMSLDLLDSGIAVEVLKIEPSRIQIRNFTSTGSEFVELALLKEDDTSGAGDNIGIINFAVLDSSVETDYARILSKIIDTTDNGALLFDVRADNSATFANGLTITGDDSVAGRSYLTVNARINSDLAFGFDGVGSLTAKIAPFSASTKLGIVVQDNASFTVGTAGTLAIPAIDNPPPTSDSGIDADLGTAKGSMGLYQSTTSTVVFVIKATDDHWYGASFIRQTTS